MKGFNRASSVHVPASHGRAVWVSKGDRFKIIDVEGRQVGDLVAWNAADPSEHLSPSHTVTHNWSVGLRPGDQLVTNRRVPIFRILEDSVGYHDIVVPCCDPEAYFLRYGMRDHRSCRCNLEEALAEVGVGHAVHGERAWNVFMKTRIGGDLRVVYEEPTHGPGSYILLECLMDALVAVSACPQDQTPTNGWNCTPLELEIWKRNP